MMKQERWLLIGKDMKMIKSIPTVNIRWLVFLYLLTYGAPYAIVYLQEVINMPEISRFYGIVIKMFFKPKEHEPSHLHALYGEHIGIFDLRTMEMTEGDLPKKAQELVKEWMLQNKKELLEMWDSKNLKKLPPL